VCHECAEEEEAKLEVERARRDEREQEKKKLQELYKGPQLKKKHDTSLYYIVYWPWVKKWKEFIDNTYIENPPQPYTANDLICEHGFLKYDPSIFYGATSVPESNIMLLSAQTYQELIQK
jgi:hypothetical protein